MTSESNSINNDTPPSLSEKTPIVAIIAPSIYTLEELREQHSIIIQRENADPNNMASPGELLGLLTSAQKLGRYLKDFNDRDKAQSIMDFWVAMLVRQEPQAINSSHLFTLEVFDENVGYHQSGEIEQNCINVTEIIRLADQILSETQGELLEKVKPLLMLASPIKKWSLPFFDRTNYAKVTERLLLRFVRLKEKSTEPYAVPVKVNDLVFIAEPNTKELLERFISVGVIKPQKSTDGTISKYELGNIDLLKKWNFLVEIIKQRQAFRQLAYGWDKGGRQTHALLDDGIQLQDSLDYPVDEVELEFRNVSIRKGNRQNNIYKGISFIFLILIISLAFVGGELYSNNAKLKKTTDDLNANNITLKKQTNELNKQKEELETKSKKLVENEKELKDLNQKLGEKFYKISGKYDVLVISHEQKDQELKISMTKNSQLYSLNDQLKNAPKASETVMKILEFATKESDKSHKNIKGFVEIFIPLSSGNKAMDKATEYANALIKKDFDIPANMPLPRHSIPKVTEVRYFYKEDKELADSVRKILIDKGISKDKVKVKKSIDETKTAPKRFIQISIASSCLS